MRWTALLAGAFCVGAAAAPAYMNELRLPITGAVAPDSGGGELPKATRGQYLGLACTNIEQVENEAVAVVMYLSKNEPPTGVAGVLATDRAIEPGIVHVRVPDMPELADHTVRVKVYYLDNEGKHVCDGGRVRIS